MANNYIDRTRHAYFAGPHFGRDNEGYLTFHLNSVPEYPNPKDIMDLDAVPDPTHERDLAQAFLSVVNKGVQVPCDVVRAFFALGAEPVKAYRKAEGGWKVPEAVWAFFTRGLRDFVAHGSVATGWDALNTGWNALVFGGRFAEFFLP